jgi:hypothetical protein
LPSVRIWTPESDYDAKAVLLLSEKLVAYLDIDISIKVKGKPDRQIAKKGSRGLKAAIKNYLQEDNCVIFVIDHDGPQAQANRRQEPNSLINQIEKVVELKEFQGRVHLVEAVNELEAWLLIDCTGIFCYFAQNSHTLPKTCQQDLCSRECRNQIEQHKEFWRLITKYTKGDTASIEEPEPGSNKGVKEYLIKFSQEIFQVLHPQTRKMDKSRQYKEALAPKIAEYIKIDATTLKRNESLTKLGEQLNECSND